MTERMNYYRSDLLILRREGNGDFQVLFNDGTWGPIDLNYSEWLHLEDISEEEALTAQTEVA